LSPGDAREIIREVNALLDAVEQESIEYTRSKQTPGGRGASPP
jgi:hypothetical protein